MFKTILICLLLNLSLSTLSATTLEVPSNYNTIQSAVDAAVNGDTILISPGTYIEYVNCAAKEVHLISTDGAEQTILEAVSPTAHIIQFYNSSFPSGETFSTVNGFTFKYANGGPSARAINAWGTSPLITGNIFTENGSGLAYNTIHFVSSNSVIHHNIFYKNNSTCIAVNNSLNETVSIYNNTFHENTRGIVGGEVYHNIFSMTTYNEYSVWTDDGFNSVHRLSYPYEYPDTTTKILDPQFMDTSSADFQLQPHSQAINAGNPNVKEIDNSIIDLGRFTTADSLLPLANEIHFTPIVDTNMVQSLTPDIIWSYWDTAATSQSSLQIQIGTDEDWTVTEIWNSGTIIATDTVYSYNGPTLSNRETYHIRVRVDNGNGFGAWKDTTFFTNISPISLSVPSDYSTIQGAIDIALNDDTILFEPGDYISDFDNLEKRLHYVSTSGPSSTSIEPVSSNSPVFDFALSLNGGVTLIEGFTIKNGYIGISAQNGSYVIRNNIIEENTNGSSPLPGGIYLKNSINSIIENNIIRNNNTVFFGGALVIENCIGDTIRYNLMYNNSGDPEIRLINNSNNLVFYNNTVDIGSGDGFFHGSNTGVSSLYNNIFINTTGVAVRTPSNGSHSVNGGFNLFYNNSIDIDGSNISLSNNLFDNPLLTNPNIGNYNLLVVSPCIDNGDPSTFFNDPDGTRNDIGAIPFDSLQLYYFVLHAPTPLYQTDILYELTPMFIWSESVDPEIDDTLLYSLYIDTMFDFSTASVIDSLTDTTLSLQDSLNFHSPYFWKVVAYDQNGFENETEMNSFYTWTLGDVNNSKSTDIADLVYYVDYSFGGGPSFTPSFIGDVNADCNVDVADIVRLVDHMFGGTGTQLDPGCE